MTQPRFPFGSYPTGWFAVALTETAHGLVRERERGEESLI